ncbi:MAG: hypothetical protein QJR06_04040 [Alicyclobacillaceae bacterium]|nr:hypothetical protein [Alicyclobacillaceae bacterium]
MTEEHLPRDQSAWEWIFGKDGQPAPREGWDPAEEGEPSSVEPTASDPFPVEPERHASPVPAKEREEAGFSRRASEYPGRRGLFDWRQGIILSVLLEPPKARRFGPLGWRRR